MAWTQVANIRGPTGPTGATGAAGQGINWRGSWVTATTYNPYDAVDNNGSSYICIATNSSQAPPNATYWNLMAQQGATGATGAPGNPGSAGPAGTRGSLWYTGSGNPGTITGQQANDIYLDTATGNVWQFS
jgi:hypothetical protein